MIYFSPQDHSYRSLDPNDKTSWTSVTSVVAMFKDKFNPREQALKSSKNRRSKWYGIPPEEIELIWASETERSITLGTFYHDQREKELLSHDTIARGGRELPIFRPLIVDGIKRAPDQKLTNGIYPEHMIYLRSAAICGQSDFVEVCDNIVSVTDYKTNKEIKPHGYKNWRGEVKKLSEPLSHLDDCNKEHYSIQLSLYLYMILKHNPTLKPGNLSIQHVIFEESGKDKYGNPIMQLDFDGNPIVKDVNIIPLPYYKREVESIITYLSQIRSEKKIAGHGKDI